MQTLQHANACTSSQRALACAVSAGAAPHGFASDTHVCQWPCTCPQFHKGTPHSLTYAAHCNSTRVVLCCCCVHRKSVSLSVCPRFNAHHANTHTHQEIDAEVARRCDAYEAERVTDDASRLQQLQKVRDFLMNTQQRCWQQEISNNSTITSRRACAAAAASQRNCAQSFVASCLSLLDALDCLGLRRVPSSPLVVVFLQSIIY
jgi:hypothetical protein